VGKEEGREGGKGPGRQEGTRAKREAMREGWKGEGAEGTGFDDDVMGPDQRMQRRKHTEK